MREGTMWRRLLALVMAITLMLSAMPLSTVMA